MHLHELLYFLNIHLKLYNKAFRARQRTTNGCMRPFCFFFALWVTVRDPNGRLDHHKKRLIIYRVSKAVCRRQLETAQGFAVLEQVSGNVSGLRSPARKSWGHGQVPASHHPTAPDAAPWHGGNPPGETTFTSGQHMPNLSFGLLFLTFFVESIS